MEFKNNKSDFNKCSSGLCCTKIENLCVTKGNQEILKNVNLHIHCGELTALIGANGAGKSTLLKLILNQLSPLEGEIKLLGTNSEKYKDFASIA